MSAAKHSSRIPLATRFAAWAFRGIVRMWPADTRDWARGMQSELTDITDARESLRWLQGGVMSLTKAWWNRALFGAKSGERRPLKLPGIGAIAFLLLAIISLALPGMRQGLTAVVQTWQSSRGGLSDSELRALGAQAERTHDAKLLAFVAMRLEPGFVGSIALGGSCGITRSESYLDLLPDGPFLLARVSTDRSRIRSSRCTSSTMGFLKLGRISHASGSPG